VARPEEVLEVESTGGLGSVWAASKAALAGLGEVDIGAGGTGWRAFWSLLTKSPLETPEAMYSFRSAFLCGSR
jgi:hypothetical protein